jgi:hypothetical protein
MLDGFVVDVGNNLYDLLLNQMGMVIGVALQQITVDFGQGRIITYSGNGALSGRRRLYWSNPILTLPQKADPQWQQLQAVVNAIRANP